MKRKFIATLVGVTMIASLAPQSKVSASDTGKVTLNHHEEDRIYPTGLSESELAKYRGSENETYIDDNVISAQNTMRSVVSNDALPTSVDNSKSKYFPPIGNQKSIGSCHHWGATYYQATYALNKYYDRRANPLNILSPKFNYVVGDITEKGSASIQEVPLTDFDTVENLYSNPFDLRLSEEKQFKDRENLVDYHGEFLYSYDEKTPFTSVDDEDLYAVKKHLADGNLADMGVDVYWFNYDKIVKDSRTPGNNKYEGETIVTSQAGNINTNSGFHSMTIVGYDDSIWVDINKNDIVDEGEMGAFKLANSWGTDWGNDGFVWMSYDACNEVSSCGGIESKGEIRRTSAMQVFSYYEKTNKDTEPMQYILATVSTDQSDAVRLNAYLQADDDDYKYYDYFQLRGYPGYNYSGGTGTEDATILLDYTRLMRHYDYDINVQSAADIGTWFTLSDVSKKDSHTYTLKNIRLVDHVKQKTYCADVSNVTIDHNETTVHIDTSKVLPTITSFTATANSIDWGESITLFTNVVDTKGKVNYRYLASRNNGEKEVIGESNQATLSYTPEKPGEYEFYVEVTDDNQVIIQKRLHVSVKAGAHTTTIYYSDYENPNIHYKVGNGSWTSVPGIPMEKTEEMPGYNYKTVIRLDETNRLTACFNDGNGNWDNNNTKNYTLEEGYYIVDNGEITQIPDPNKNEVVVYYWLPNGQAYIHYQVGDGSWTSGHGIAMQPCNDRNGYNFKAVIDLGDANEIKACFNDGMGHWDNNNTNDYTFGYGSWGFVYGTQSRFN